MKVKDAYMQAFPFIEPIDNDDAVKAFHPGMTLRDYFAGMAMQAFLSNDNLLRASCEWHADGSETSIAVLAYDQADAMLKARDKC
jgi:hypothetical protein